MIIKHKFLDLFPLQGKKILIIGTFNPDVTCNDAKFFYGRAKNFFWRLLPEVFGKESLKGNIKGQKEFYLTRKSFDKSVQNIRDEIYKIKEFCDRNGIKFRFLPTPSRFYSQKKLEEWRRVFH